MKKSLIGITILIGVVVLFACNHKTVPNQENQQTNYFLNDSVIVRGNFLSNLFEGNGLKNALSILENPDSVIIYRNKMHKNALLTNRFAKLNPDLFSVLNYYIFNEDFYQKDSNSFDKAALQDMQFKYFRSGTSMDIIVALDHAQITFRTNSNSITLKNNKDQLFTHLINSLNQYEISK